ncbi:MAG: AI-2E family transporter, partial [Pseudomonadota bacterium]
MTVQEQVRYWGIGLAVFVLLLWLLADALLPFVMGAAIAYLTDPWADWLEDHGLSRVLATVVITVCSVGMVIVSILLIVPQLVGQVQQVVDQVPTYIDQGRALMVQWLPEAEKEGTFLNKALTNLRENAQSWSVSLLQRVGSFGIAVANLLAVALVTPVVAFYLLMDWDDMVAGIDDYLPREHRDEIRYLASELDRVLSGFVRGQLTVCMILGIFYAVTLMILGLNFGLLIGVFAGLIS